MFRYTILMFIMFFSSALYAQCTDRYIDCVSQQKISGVHVNGDMRGHIVEGRNTIYVRNIKLYNDNPNQSILQVVGDENSKKRIIVENVEVNSKNASIYSNTGAANLVNFDLKNDNDVFIKNVEINSSGVNRYTSDSSNKQNAAGTFGVQISGKAAEKVDISKVNLNLSGYDVNNAIQSIP